MILSEGSSEKYGMVLCMIFTSTPPSPTFRLFGNMESGTRLMVDPDVKSFVCLVARRN